MRVFVYRPDNVKQIARAIETLRDNPYLAEQMGKNGRKAWKKNLIGVARRKKLLNCILGFES